VRPTGFLLIAPHVAGIRDCLKVLGNMREKSAPE
jgi:hypothetical protein